MNGAKQSEIPSWKEVLWPILTASKSLQSNSQSYGLLAPGLGELSAVM